MKNFKIFIAATCLAIGFTACDLDRDPKNSLPREQALLSIEDARRWNNGHMSGLRGVQYGVYFNLADKQADFLHPKADYGNNQADFYRFDLRSTDYDTRDVWGAYYNRLININEFIAKAASMESSATLSRFVADAHFIRAYYYLELAKRYAPAYNVATASSDLCVPLVTEFDVKARPGRATQSEIYKQILADIATAKAEYTKAGLTGGSQGSITLTPDALSAIEVRAYLQMNDYQNAFDVAKALIATNRYPLGSSQAEFTAMWRSDSSTEDLVRFYVNKDETSEVPFSVAGYYGANVYRNTYKMLEPTWLPAQGIIDLYDAADYRKSVYLESIPVGTVLSIAQGLFLSRTGNATSTVHLISKYRGNLALASIANDPVWGGPRPDGRMAPKFVRIAEVYLAAAEAAYRLNNTTDAQIYLNRLRQSRGLAAVSSTGATLFTDIQNEYQREFLAEGRRLWDLKRWGLGFTRMAPQPVLSANNWITSHSRELEVASDHYCFTWPIPQDDMKTNPSLQGQQNRGY